MSNKKLGFVPVYRSIQDHWLWSNDEPFSKGQAWIDLLLSVNHEEKKIKVGNRIQVIKPGQMWTSYKKLGNRWNWSRERVYRYTKMLKSDGMLLVDATPNGTLLTLLNWDVFNGQRNTNETANETTDKTTPKTTDETTGETQTIMINNGNNVKNVNKKDRSACPGKGWYWNEEGQRWVAPPKEGGAWQ